MILTNTSPPKMCLIFFFGFFHLILHSSCSCLTLVPRVENFDPALNYVNIWTSTISITIPKNLTSPFGEEETDPEEKALRVRRVRNEKIKISRNHGFTFHKFNSLNRLTQKLCHEYFSFSNPKQEE